MQERPIKRYANDINDLDARLLVDEQFERDCITVVKYLLGGGSWKGSESFARWLRRVFEKSATEGFIGWQYAETKFPGEWVGVDHQIVSKNHSPICVCQHPMDYVTISADYLRVDQRCERFAVNHISVVCSGRFTLKRDKPSVRYLKH
jgi:hypothetical protein